MSYWVTKPKGMKRILQERGLWYEGLKKQCVREKKKNTSGMSFEERQFHELLEEYETNRSETRKDCCALCILAVVQPDFANEISLLEQVVRKAGHQVIFYPKFHCKLNIIVYFWAAVKRYTQSTGLQCLIQLV
jgi:hypothetical protein